MAVLTVHFHQGPACFCFKIASWVQALVSVLHLDIRHRVRRPSCMSRDPKRVTSHYPRPDDAHSRFQPLR